MTFFKEGHAFPFPKVQRTFRNQLVVVVALIGVSRFAVVLMERQVAIWDQRLQALVAFEQKSTHAETLESAWSSQQEWYSGSNYPLTMRRRGDFAGDEH